MLLSYNKKKVASFGIDSYEINKGHGSITYQKQQETVRAALYQKKIMEIRTNSWGGNELTQLIRQRRIRWHFEGTYVSYFVPL
jgi:hypothetical protein